MTLNPGKIMTLAFIGGAFNAVAQPPQRPNIVLIITDQQYAGKMSYMGDTCLYTPTMDRIARSGYTYANAYCTFPLSIPQRFSMFTGMYPSSCNVRFNPRKDSQEQIDHEALAGLRTRMLANLFNDAGYDTFYGGKAHLVSPTSNEDPGYYGFRTVYSIERRGELGRDAAAFLAAKSPLEDPFLMVISYINPHDICEYDDYADYDNLTESRRRTKAEGLARVKKYVEQGIAHGEERFWEDLCPELPSNFARTVGAPDVMPGKVADYSMRQWRMHRWVYDRLIEEVDRDIAPVIDALEKGGFLNNTIIVFTSDHGEMDASHMREHKSAPYREAQHVPFIIAGPCLDKGGIDSTMVVNTGIDMLPTLCDLAGIEIPDGFPGISALVKTEAGRRDIFCEGSNWYQVIRDNRYKFTLFDTGGCPEMLIDIETDPGELVNRIDDPGYRAIRDMLSEKLQGELSGRNIKLKSSK
jgi:choline-sulfatase